MITKRDFFNALVFYGRIGPESERQLFLASEMVPSSPDVRRAEVSDLTAVLTSLLDAGALSTVKECSTWSVEALDIFDVLWCRSGEWEEGVENMTGLVYSCVISTLAQLVREGIVILPEGAPQ